jgi:non-heme chloroperoxidase
MILCQEVLELFYIEVEPGVRLCVEDINPGADKTVVFLHGWPLSHNTFEYQYDVFPHYGVRCIGIDMRGYGNSDRPWGGYSYDRMAEDIKVVLDTMDVNNVTLAGHSMGGAIAIRYMARFHGQRVAKLALLAAAAPSFVQRSGYPYGMTTQQVDAFIATGYRNRPQLLTSFGGLFFGQPVTPSFLSWFQNDGLKAAGYSTIRGLEALRDEDLRTDLPKIEVPTGIFHGVLDRVCPYTFALEQNKAIRNSVLYRFDMSGHAIYYDELDKFNYNFLQFLGKQNAAQ